MTMHRAFQQAPIEAKRYVWDYTCWLEDSETLTEYIVAVSPPTTPPLVAQNAVADLARKKMSVMITGGVSKHTYTIMMVVTTSTGQKKRDDIQMRVISQ